MTGIPDQHNWLFTCAVEAHCDRTDTCTGGAVVISWAQTEGDLYSCYLGLKSRSALRRVHQTYCHLFFVLGVPLWILEGVLKCCWKGQVAFGVYLIQVVQMVTIKCPHKALFLYCILTSYLRTFLLGYFGSSSSLVFAAISYPNPPIATVKRGCGFYYPGTKADSELKEISLTAHCSVSMIWAFHF